MNAKALLAITITLGATATAIACVLADPPPIVTPPPAERPKIVVDSASPPLGAILHTNPPCTNTPDCFVVTVEADPNASLTYKVFVDLDPTGAPTQVPIHQHTDEGGVLAVGPEAGTNGQRVFAFAVNVNFDPTQCHTITLVVAYGFVDNDFSKPITPPGGDTATWFYQPTTSDCSLYDAGAPD